MYFNFNHHKVRFPRENRGNYSILPAILGNHEIYISFFCHAGFVYNACYLNAENVCKICQEKISNLKIRNYLMFNLPNFLNGIIHLPFLELSIIIFSVIF